MFISLYQQTPMHSAANEGNEYTIEGLVAQGADINIKDRNGVSLAVARQI